MHVFIDRFLLLDRYGFRFILRRIMEWLCWKLGLWKLGLWKLGLWKLGLWKLGLFRPVRCSRRVGQLGLRRIGLLLTFPLELFLLGVELFLPRIQLFAPLAQLFLAVDSPGIPLASLLFQGGPFGLDVPSVGGELLDLPMHFLFRLRSLLLIFPRLRIPRLRLSKLRDFVVDLTQLPDEPPDPLPALMIGVLESPGQGIELPAIGHTEIRRRAGKWRGRFGIGGFGGILVR